MLVECKAAVRRLARVGLTSQFMRTWAAQGSNYCIKFKGTTDEQLFEGRQVSDGGEQCWVLGVVWCRMSLVVESHRAAALLCKRSSQRKGVLALHESLDYNLDDRDNESWI
jgi:hypothetical protein